MKTCPYCWEQIQDSAIKCKFCWEFLKEKKVATEKEIIYDFRISSRVLKIVWVCLLCIVFFTWLYYVYKNYFRGSALDNIYKSIVEIRYTESDGNGGGWSWILFSKDGLILTNNHVIEGNDFWASIGDIQICILEDISKEPSCDYEAELIIRNSYEDLAILKIKNYYWKNYVNLFHGINTPKNKYVWQTVNAIWYPWLWWGKLTITEWIIAWFDEYDDFKTDAEVNHWNSWWGSFNKAGVFLWIPYYMSYDESWKISRIISIFNIKKRFNQILYKSPINNIYSSDDFVEKNLRYNNENKKEYSVEDEQIYNEFMRLEDHNKDYEGMLKKIDKILELRPESPLAYEYAGDAYYGLWDYESALSLYDYSIGLNPFSITAYMGYGNSLYALKMYDDAISRYEDVIDSFDHIDEINLSVLYYNLWLCYEAIWKIDIANEYYDKSIELESKVKIDSSDVSEIEDSTNSQVEANEICQWSFWLYSYGDWTIGKEWKYNCYCKDWYIRESDADDSQCVKK